VAANSQEERMATPPPTPPPAPLTPPVQPAGEPTGLTPNMAGGLAYITIIPAIIFLVVAPYNRDQFVRFHSWQSLILGVGSLVVHIVLRLIPFFGWIASALFSILVLVLWLIAMLKAFQGVEWKIPVIGDLAKQQATKGGI
jgi:uncharacterized membrane protein